MNNVGYRSWQVKSMWWYELCEQLVTPTKAQFGEHAGLANCWLPDKRTDRAVGDLLPVIGLEASEDDKELVRDWLITAVGVRTHMEQVTTQEWKELLCERIPELAPPGRMASNERLRDKVAGWYEACLDASADRDDVPEKVFATCPLLCRKADLWDYVAEEQRYLADDHELGIAFSQVVWILDIPSRLRAAVEKYFGVPSLSSSVQVEIVPGESGRSLEGDLEMRFAETLPYVFAWRLAQTRQDTERLRAQLTSLKVQVVPALTARLALNAASTTIERFFAVRESDLFLREDHVNEATLAQALAEAIGVKTEADFYENLLRCNGDAQRKEKLLAKGRPESEVDRSLRDYAVWPPADMTSPEKPPEARGAAPGTIDSPPPPPAPPGKPGVVTPPPPVSLPPAEPIELKDPCVTEYVVGTGPPPYNPEEKEEPQEKEKKIETARQVLPQEEKVKVEKCGRAFARRGLERAGYVVEEMPLDHPGFDLRATRGSEELRVEVKAHVRRATVVDVTHRQYSEYLASNRVGGGQYGWELWNVEYLRQDERNPVTITKYADVPDDALDTRVFRVDLKKCSPAVED